MDTVGTVKIEFWAVVLGATDAILNLEMPYGYELKRLKLNDTPLYEEVVNARGNLDVKYIASNLADDANQIYFLYKAENNSMPLEYFSVGEMLGETEKTGNILTQLLLDGIKKFFT